jgi:hypothetical protein
MSWLSPVPAVNNARIVMTATDGRNRLLIDVPPERDALPSWLDLKALSCRWQIG